MNEIDTQSYLDGLNKEQCEAVQSPVYGSILVLAGAGCGKTTVLTKRIGWIFNNGVDCTRICALTFTRKASEEMRVRVSKLACFKSETTAPLISTFHSFSLSILNDIVDDTDNFTKLGYRKKPVLQSDKERLRLIYEITNSKERDFLGLDLSGLDALLAKHVIFPESIKKFGNEQISLLNGITSRITQKKKETGFWSFDDLTPAVIELFKKCESIHKYYKNRFQYFLVDEFQDTNPVQIEFLKMLLKEETGLFVVGDDDQAIYGFRGADIRPTMEFCTIFPNARLIKLQTNYRSMPSILNVANKVFKNKPIEYRKVLKSGLFNNRKGNNPTRVGFDNQEDMVNWVLKECANLSKKLAISICECVILFRINHTREWVEEFIKKRGLDKKDVPQLLTVHASKGLEFPVVFLSDLEDSVFPSYKITHTTHRGRFLSRFIKGLFTSGLDIDCDWDEEKRLFYVGITRAQKVLYFISVKNKLVFGKKRTFKKSRLLRLI